MIAIGYLHLELLAMTDEGLSTRQMPPNLVSQMWQVQAAEYPVPVGVVTLGRKQLTPSLCCATSCGEQSAERQALLMGPIRLGIPDQEMLPVAATKMGHEPIDIRTDS